MGGVLMDEQKIGYLLRLDVFLLHQLNIQHPILVLDLIHQIIVIWNIPVVQGIFRSFDVRNI